MFYNKYMRFLLSIIIIYTLIFNNQYGLLIINKLNGEKESLVVKIANTEEERIKGLSDKEFLLPGFGMLFILDSEYKVGIWMKDMNFPINIYWFKKDLKIDSFLKDIYPETYPNVFYSQGDVLYVLETRTRDVLDNTLDLDLTYINKHDKNIKTLWQILQHLHFHLK